MVSEKNANKLFWSFMFLVCMAAISIVAFYPRLPEQPPQPTIYLPSDLGWEQDPTSPFVRFKYVPIPSDCDYIRTEFGAFSNFAGERSGSGIPINNPILLKCYRMTAEVK